MKLRIILSILFLITTTFASIHEMEHIEHPDDSTCLVCHIGDNLSAADNIEKCEEVEIINFGKIVKKSQNIPLHERNKSNQNRAPPVIS